MTDLESVRKFDYRPCRVPTGFDVDFVAGEETFHGLCRDVSDAGIRVKLDGAVAVGDSGKLVLHHPTGVLKLDAQVAYIDHGHVGFEFISETDWERTTINEFMTAIAKHAAASMVVRFP
jgi:hypothetical protein